MCPRRFVPRVTATHRPCQRTCDAGDIRIGSVYRSARARRFRDETGQHVRADARDIFLVFEKHAERSLYRGFVELAGSECRERHRPIEGLRDARTLEELVAAKSLDDCDDAAREPRRYVGETPRDDRQLAVDTRVIDPLVQAPAFQCVVDLARAIRRDDDRRRDRGPEGTELGHCDLEVGQQLEQVGLELLVGSVDLIDEEHGGRTVARDRLEKRAPDQEALAVDAVAGFIGAPFALRETDLKYLPRIVPVVYGRRDVEALVALETDELSAERGGEGFCDLRLADAGLTLDEEGLTPTQREKERDRERAVCDVALVLERGSYILDRRHGRRAHQSRCYERGNERAPAPSRRRRNTTRFSVRLGRAGSRVRSLASRTR